jgi:beta-glucosidase
LIRGHQDFLGVNYYFTAYKMFDAARWRVADKPWKGPVSDLGWPIRPEGLLEVLREFRRWGVPLYVTENGVADERDVVRADYIRRHLQAVEQAQQEGIDVRGYFHWSLLDNFEWAEGFRPRFGLVAVDFATQERKPRASAYVYRAIIQRARHTL